MINESDIPGFFISADSVNLDDYLICDFEFETTLDPKLAAAAFCSEQSTAQWKRAGVAEDFRPRFAAKVIDLKIISESKTPYYDFPWIHENHFTRCLVKIIHPIRNFGPRLPNLLSALAGEGSFYCPGMTTLRWLDIQFPISYLQQFSGPQFGIDGLRSKLNVYDRPLFIGVVKPNIGLSGEAFAELTFESLAGGLDIAKDDEMLADAPESALADRIKFAGQARLKAEKETGLPKIMLAHITDEISALKRNLELAENLGANSCMVNVYFTGLPVLRYVRELAQVPIMSHFTGMALYDRVPHFGIDGVVMVKLQRLAGADIIGLPGFGERMQGTPESVRRNVEACLSDMGPIKKALPIPGGSDWAGSLESVFRQVGHVDFGFISGRGVFGHPSGPRAGAKSLHQAWEAIVNGYTLQDYRMRAKELDEVLRFFGS